MLEQLVRPFQRPDLGGQKILVPSIGKRAEIVVVEFGKLGKTGPSGADGLKIKIGKDTDEVYKETHRTTRQVKVVNPKDKNQFVVIDEAKEITLKKKKAKDDQPKKKDKERNIAYSPGGGSEETIGIPSSRDRDKQINTVRLRMAESHTPSDEEVDALILRYKYPERFPGDPAPVT